MIELRLFGGLAISGPASVTDGASPLRRALAVLALVAVSAPHPIGREKLLGFLWPESDAERARNSLRQAVFALRRDLGDDIFLPESAGALQLNASRLTVDLWEFRAALARKALAEAVAVYRGPFLDGFDIRGLPEFSQWVEGEREALQRRYMEALESLAGDAGAAGRHEETVRWRRLQAAAAPLDARTALLLLRALADAGDRTGALQHAALYERLIRAQLDADPDSSVVEFAESLRRTPAASRSVTPLATPVVTPPRSAVGPSEPMPATPAVEVGDEGAARVPVRIRRARRVTILLGASVVVLGAASTALLVGSGDARLPLGVDAGSERIIASGEYGVAGRDEASRLIACEGPACPAGLLPQGAFVVPAHAYHMPPDRGTTYISPVSDGTSRASPGYACCTVATFERQFILPPEATTASISVVVHADNHATVSINGVEFGRQRDTLATANYADSAKAFTRTFRPDPSGTNRLQVKLWDGGGALALHYRAVVTYGTALTTDSAWRQTSIARDAKAGDRYTSRTPKRLAAVVVPPHT